MIQNFYEDLYFSSGVFGCHSAVLFMTVRYQTELFHPICMPRSDAAEEQ